MPVIELKITMDERGIINVHGPIGDKLLCYGLLEFARQIIQVHVPSPIIQSPNGMKVIKE